MSKAVLKELDDLLEHGVIGEEDSRRIRNYYAQKPDLGSNRLIIVFGILGALLVGMGLVLIIAHNWDLLPKSIKLGLALLPLLTGQAVCGYLLWKKSVSIAWREGGAVFVMFAIAVSIAIVSQVYNIQGDLGNFLFVWMLLSLPLMYVMRSSAASLLFWIGITWYACQEFYFQYRSTDSVWQYVLLAASAFPWYLQLCKKSTRSNFTTIHHFVIAGSLIITLGIFSQYAEELMLPAYLFLFGVFVLIGQLPFFSAHRLISNAYLISGSIGIVTILLMLSFDFYWTELNIFDKRDWLLSPEFFVCLALFGSAIGLFIYLLRNQKASALLSKSYVIPIFIVLFSIGLIEPYVAQILTNLVILILAVYTIREGAKADHLGRMNYGLMILTVLILCRFFDTDLSFVIRGLLFVMVGLGFFAMNYRMVKKRKERSV